MNAKERYFMVHHDDINNVRNNTVSVIVVNSRHADHPPWTAQTSSKSSNPAVNREHKPSERKFQSPSRTISHSGTSRSIAFAISAIQVNLLETEIPVSIGFDRNAHRSSHVVTTNRSEQSTGYNIGATKLRCKHEIPKGGDEWRRFSGGRENLHAGWPPT